jgi:prepilin-type N-terminal cleavage/methylation domain-containing protein
MLTTPGKNMRRSQRGFTLIEVMLSMVVMTIGLLSLLAVFGVAMASTQSSQTNGIAKQLANEAIEGILTARETATIPWSSIQNTGNGGIFLSGPQPIDCAGADGIIGTADDADCGPQILEQPGPTGVWVGTCPPDTCYTLSNFTRTITINEATGPGGTPIPSLNLVTITITYVSPQLRVPQNYVLTTYVSEYR